MTDTFWIVVGLVFVIGCGLMDLRDKRRRAREYREYFMRADFGNGPS